MLLTGLRWGRSSSESDDGRLQENRRANWVNLQTIQKLKNCDNTHWQYSALNTWITRVFWSFRDIFHRYLFCTLLDITELLHCNDTSYFLHLLLHWSAQSQRGSSHKCRNGQIHGIWIRAVILDEHKKRSHIYFNSNLCLLTKIPQICL